VISVAVLPLKRSTVLSQLFVIIVDCVALSSTTAFCVLSDRNATGGQGTDFFGSRCGRWLTGIVASGSGGVWLAVLGMDTGSAVLGCR